MSDSIQGENRNIQVLRGLSTARSLLSTSREGDLINLWDEDDGSDRQRWNIEPVSGTDTFTIEVRGGVSGDGRFLSGNPANGSVSLKPNANSPKEKWEIQQIGSNIPSYFNIISISPSGKRGYLSTSADGQTVSLQAADDGSGRQRWQLQ